MKMEQQTDTSYIEELLPRYCEGMTTSIVLPFNFKSLQIYSKLFWHPTFKGDKVTLANPNLYPIPTNQLLLNSNIK